jgi:sarcosine oxidase/L-pipecolate oxidase
MSQLKKDSSILIIGGGTWGCSTALQLARAGYINVTVLERSPIPSPTAAGNDVNKIMEEGTYLISPFTSTLQILQAALTD